MEKPVKGEIVVLPFPFSDLTIVDVATKWTNLPKNQETSIYPGESPIQWMLKFQRNFKHMETPLVQKVMAFTITQRKGLLW